MTHRPLKSDIIFWLPLMLVSWYLAWKYQEVYVVDWDGFDYTTYAVTGKPSALGLGRALFLAGGHVLWKIAHNWFGLPLERSYLVLRSASIVLAGPATVGFYALFLELSLNRLAALCGALLIAASPFYIIYSGRGMSEIPAFFMLSWSMWWMLRSLREGRAGKYLAAAFLIGLSANLREFAIFFIPFVGLAAVFHGLRWKYGLLAVGLVSLGAISGILFWTAFDPQSYWPAAINWYQLSANERRIYPVTAKNLLYFADFAFNCSAAATILTPVSFIRLWSRKNLRLLLVFGLCGLAANLMLIANHDLPVNPRYLLTGLMGPAAVAGWFLVELMRWRRIRSLPLLLGLLILTKASYNHMAGKLYDNFWAARGAQEYITRIENLPWHSAFIVGARTPLIHFYAGVGVRPHWRAISTGAAWPDGKLGDAIGDLMAAGRPVYVDFDPEIWQPGLRDGNRQEQGLEMIKHEYELQHLHDHMFLIVRKRITK